MRIFRQLDDFGCIARAQGGDGAAFSELVARYQDRIYRYILRLTHSQEDARDLTQETFMHAYRGLAKWQPEATFASWLFRIGRNLAFDQLRRGKLAQFVALDDDAQLIDPSCRPDTALEIAQGFQALEAALARLAIDHREILLLREIEEMSYGDIASILNLSLGTVKSRLARARAALLENMSTPLEEP